MNVHGKIAAAAIAAALSFSVGVVPALAEEADTAAAVEPVAIEQEKAQPQHMAVVEPTAVVEAAAEPVAEPAAEPAAEPVATKEVAAEPAAETVAESAATADASTATAEEKPAEVTPAEAPAESAADAPAEAPAEAPAKAPADANKNSDVIVVTPVEDDAPSAPTAETVNDVYVHVQTQGNGYYVEPSIDKGKLEFGPVTKAEDGTYHSALTIKADGQQAYVDAFNEEYRSILGKHVAAGAFKEKVFDLIYREATDWDPAGWFAANEDDNALVIDLKKVIPAKPTKKQVEAELRQVVNVGLRYEDYDWVDTDTQETYDILRYSYKIGDVQDLGNRYKVTVTITNPYPYVQKYAKTKGGAYALDGEWKNITYDLTLEYSEDEDAWGIFDPVPSDIIVKKLDAPTLDEINTAINNAGIRIRDAKGKDLGTVGLLDGTYTVTVGNGTSGISASIKINQDEHQAYIDAFNKSDAAAGKCYVNLNNPDNTRLSFAVYYENGKWVAHTVDQSIYVKDITPTTEVINAAVNNAAITMADKDYNVLAKYGLIDGTYDVKVSTAGTMPSASIVIKKGVEGTQPYIDKLNSENPGKFYVNLNNPDNTSRRFYLYYRDGKWTSSFEPDQYIWVKDNSLTTDQINQAIKDNAVTMREYKGRRNTPEIANIPLIDGTYTVSYGTNAKTGKTSATIVINQDAHQAYVDALNKLPVAEGKFYVNLNNPDNTRLSFVVYYDPATGEWTNRFTDQYIYVKDLTPSTATINAAINNAAITMREYKGRRNTPEVAKYGLIDGTYDVKVSQGRNGSISASIVIKKGDEGTQPYIDKLNGESEGKHYVNLNNPDNTSRRFYLYYRDGKWVSTFEPDQYIWVKDITLTTDDVNAAMGEPAVYLVDRDVEETFATYNILPDTYTVEYDGTHAHLTIVGQGQQAYIDKLNSENPGKFYVSENGLTRVPLSYDLEYKDGKWGLSSVGQYQIAVWDVAPITGKVKVSDGTTTKEYDLAQGTFDHSAIAYDDATGTCRTTITLTDYDAYIAKYSAAMGRTYRRVAGSPDVTYELVYDMTSRPRKRAWTMAEASAAKAAPRHMRAMAVAEVAEAAPASNDTIQVEPVPQATVDYGYDADGDGKNETKVITAGDDNKVSVETPTRDGYDFKGWKTADGQDFDPSQQLHGDVEIIAQWDKKPEPSKPDQPDTPDQPAKPDQPSAPAQPDQPAQPEQPVQPTKPAAQKSAETPVKQAVAKSAPAKAAMAKSATPATGDATNNGVAAGLLAGGAALLVAAKKRLGLKD